MMEPDERRLRFYEWRAERAARFSEIYRRWLLEQAALYMESLVNCPSCGVGGSGYECVYCGTILGGPGLVRLSDTRFAFTRGKRTTYVRKVEDHWETDAGKVASSLTEAIADD